MDSISKTEFIIAGGALVTAVGASWYLNNRINELEEHFKELTDKLAKLITKSSTDSQKIDSIGQHILSIRESITGLKKDIKTISDSEEKKDKLIALHSSAILELQTFIKSQFEMDDGYLKHEIRVKKSRNKSSRNKKKHEKSESSESSSENTESDSEDIVESMKRAKHKS
jgi:flagellar biosynthesis component FlhA